MDIELSEPLSGEVTLPSLDYDRTEISRPPYREARVREELASLRTLVLSIDLRRGRVVGMAPGLAG